MTRVVVTLDLLDPFDAGPEVSRDGPLVRATLRGSGDAVVFERAGNHVGKFDHDAFLGCYFRSQKLGFGPSVPNDCDAPALVVFDRVLNTSRGSVL